MGNKHGNTKKAGRNIFGKFLTLVQLILSVLFITMLAHTGMVPGKYMDIIVILVYALFAIIFIVQFTRSKMKYIAVIFSLILSALMVIGMFGMHTVNTLLSSVGGAEYKTDNMVVVVRFDDPAQTLFDTADYDFGIQSTIDKGNTEKMVDEVRNVLEKRPKIKEFNNMPELAEGLLRGDVDAAIYNDAFTGVMEEAINGYRDEIRVIHHYGIKTELEKPEEEKKAITDQAFNVYISGIDVSGAVSTTSRSDVNIIMTVNPVTKRILLTTTPRDYYVPIPDISGGAPDKLTHAGIYGVDASIRTLEALYGIDISYYGRVNFTSVVTIVDALGGIEVNSEYAFDAGGYSFQVGPNELDGDAALAFSRERYSFESGDNQRGKNQQAVITAMLQKAMTPAVLSKANQILVSLGDSVETNMTREEMSKFINMQLGDNASWTIEANAVIGTGDEQPCFSSGSQLLYVMRPDTESVRYASQKIEEVMKVK